MRNPLSKKIVPIILLGVFFMLIPWLLHGLEWPTVIASTLGHCPKQNCDFLNHYLPQAVRIHNNQTTLQEGWFYPPTLAILLEPLVWLPTDWPSYIWTGINILFMFWLSLQGKALFPKQVRYSYVWSLALISTSMPVLSSIKWGQISLLVICLCWWGLSKTLSTNKQTLAGMAIGLAGAIKGFPLIYLLWPLWKKNLRISISAIGFFVVMGGIFPLLRIGWDQTVHHYENMIHAGQFIQQIAPRYGGQALSPSFHRWFMQGDHMMELGPALIYTLPKWLYIILFTSIVCTMSVAVLKKLSSHPLPLVLLFCWMGLLFSPGWQHYFCFLPLCMIQIWFSASSKGKLIIVAAGLIERIPIFLLNVVPNIYYSSSAWGTTTISTALLLAVVLFDVSCNTSTENVE